MTPRRARPRKKPKPIVRPPADPAAAEGHKIQLLNPMTDNFKAFIVGNATLCQRVVQPKSAEGQHIVICGAGPSLAETAEEWCPQGDQVWGCNSAATWLYEQGHKVTHAITVDQQPAMCEEWASAPPLEYLLASTVHPHLTDFLHSKERRTHFFHNYVGIRERDVELCDCGHAEGAHETGPCLQCECQAYVPKTMPFEDWMYALLYEPTIKVGSGLNTATRAIDVAYFMGASKITLLGADCAMRIKERCPKDVKFGTPEHTRWLEDNTIMHANGGHALASGATPVTLGAEIDGRWWESKPDLIISAVWLVHMARALDGILNIQGDTLPNALLTKPPEFLDRLPTIVDSEGRPLRMQDALQQTYAALG
jgi:hypothetical protein